jgi:hypothetical protein
VHAYTDPSDSEPLCEFAQSTGVASAPGSRIGSVALIKNEAAKTAKNARIRVDMNEKTQERVNERV